jgi:hypothetical protein
MAMPHYYFHLYNCDGETPDEEGQNLSGPAAARDTALTSIRSILASEVDAGEFDLDGRIEVADGDGAVLLIISFEEAVAVRLPGAQSR